VKTPAVTYLIEWHDPFGTVMASTQITVPEQDYGTVRIPESARELAAKQTAMRVGRYIQEDGPIPHPLAWIRISKPDTLDP
jgi:hypothetical protein